MTLLIILVAAALALAFLWFAYPKSRQFIAGAVVTVLATAGAVLSGLANWLQGLA